MGRWTKYFECHKNSAHHPVLQGAIEIEQFLTSDNKPCIQRKALDLGCGTGRDAIYLANNGFVLTIVDAESEALCITIKRFAANKLSRPICIHSRLEELDLSSQYDLVSSNLTLPFISPQCFNGVWSTIVQSIRFHGRFSGQFFGTSHAWANDSTMTFLSYGEVKDLFKGLFNIELFAEKAKEINTVSQGKKFWHQWDVVARKVPINPEKPLKFIFQYKVANMVVLQRVAQQNLRLYCNDNRQTQSNQKRRYFMQKAIKELYKMYMDYGLQKRYRYGAKTLSYGFMLSCAAGMGMGLYCDKSRKILTYTTILGIMISAKMALWVAVPEIPMLCYGYRLLANNHKPVSNTFFAETITREVCTIKNMYQNKSIASIR